MIKSILCAVDITAFEGDQHVLLTAAKHANIEQARLDVMTVVPTIGLTLVHQHFDHNFQEEAVNEAQRLLKELVKNTLGDQADSVRHLVSTGSIYNEILHVAEKSEADLIVIGAHQSALRNFLLGPNAARVVRHSNCSVYVVR